MQSSKISTWGGRQKAGKEKCYFASCITDFLSSFFYYSSIAQLPFFKRLDFYFFHTRMRTIDSFISNLTVIFISSLSALLFTVGVGWGWGGVDWLKHV